MRFACRISLLLILLGAAAASAQINPATQIRWPSNCVGGNLYYDIVHNICTAGTSASTVSVNGSVVSNPNFNDTTPPPTGSNQNIHFQVSGSNISAWFVPGSGGGGGLPPGVTSPGFGSLTGAGQFTAQQMGPVYQVDQFPGADMGTKITACINALPVVAGSTLGGTCDARAIIGTVSGMQGFTIPAYTTVLLGPGNFTLVSGAVITVQGPSARLYGNGPSATAITGYVNGNGVIQITGSDNQVMNLQVENTDNVDNPSSDIALPVGAGNNDISRVRLQNGYYGLVTIWAGYNYGYDIYAYGQSQYSLYDGAGNSNGYDHFHSNNPGVGCAYIAAQGVVFNHIDCEGGSGPTIVVNSAFGAGGSVTINGGYIQPSEGAYIFDIISGYVTSSGVWHPGNTLGCEGQCGNLISYGSIGLPGGTMINQTSTGIFAGGNSGLAITSSNPMFALRNLNFTNQVPYWVYLSDASNTFTLRQFGPAATATPPVLTFSQDNHIIEGGAGVDLWGGARNFGRVTTNQMGGATCSVSNTGTAGSTTYTYYVVSHDYAGGVTLPIACSTTTGNATLNSTNYNVITVNTQYGNYTYDILKGNTSTLLASAGPFQSMSWSWIILTVNDTGQSTSGYSPPSRDTTADVSIAGLMNTSTVHDTGSQWTYSGANGIISANGVGTGIGSVSAVLVSGITNPTAANGVYSIFSTYNGLPAYTSGTGYYMFYGAPQWFITYGFGWGGGQAGCIANDAPTPPPNGWICQSGWTPTDGSAPLMAALPMWRVDANGLQHTSGPTPTTDTGTISTYSNNSWGIVTGLSAATSLTLTFANGGFTTAAACGWTPYASGGAGYVSSTPGLNTSSTYTFASAYTGAIGYHCDGN